jgi:hypothetical protein
MGDGTYRERRAYLADHVSLEVPDRNTTPSDLLGPGQWAHLMDLPTDVLLRSPDYLGSMIGDMQTQAHAWAGTCAQRHASSPWRHVIRIAMRHNANQGSVRQPAEALHGICAEHGCRVVWCNDFPAAPLAQPEDLGWPSPGARDLVRVTDHLLVS